jgi:hypothetical protein
MALVKSAVAENAAVESVLAEEKSASTLYAAADKLRKTLSA